MGTRQILILALIAGFFAGHAVAQDQKTETRVREEIRSLLTEVDLNGEEAKSLIGLPETLQHRLLRALAGRFVDQSFDTGELALVEALPKSLKARLAGRLAGVALRPEEGKAPERKEEPDQPAPMKNKRGPRPGEPGEKEKERPPSDTGPARDDLPSQKTPAAPAEEDRRRPFGSELFAPDRDTPPQAPVLPVPSDYVIGPGDVFLIHYWNTLIDSTFNAEVTAEGRIRLPKAGEIAVAGLTMKAVRDLLETRLRDVYKDASVSVTLHALRTIRVFVAGEVRDPGLHAIHALGTVLHALFQAGGPSERGSYRRIHVIRSGAVHADVDLYDFLISGKLKTDLRLLGGDTVFVPLARSTVTVVGEVRRPGIFELRNEANLAQVLELAGGVTASAASDALRIDRPGPKGRQLLDVSVDPASVPVRDGDRVDVPSVRDENDGRVEVKGNVARPGPYAWTEGMKVSSLLKRCGGLLPDTYLGYAELKRRVDAGDGSAVQVAGRTYFPAHRITRVDLRAILGGDETADLELQPLDRLTVLHLDDAGLKLTVELLGAVEKPGVFAYGEGMRLLDLLLGEGRSLSPDAHLGRAEILRLADGPRDYAYAHGTERTRARRETIPVDLSKALAGDGDANPALMPFDVVKIYFASEVRAAPTVSVSGSVGQPGTYELTAGMRVSELVFRAGNITPETWLDEAELVRRVEDPGAPSGYRLETVRFHLGRALQGKAEDDPVLQNFDRLLVKETDEFFVEVRITGEVRFPGAYLMPKGAKLADLVTRAGGYTPQAYLPGAFFTRDDIRALQEKAQARFLADQKARLLELESEAQAAASDPDTAAKIRASIRARQSLLDELEKTEPAGRLAIRLEDTDAFLRSEANIPLRRGDVLHIPDTPVAVTVHGEVFNPGSVLYTANRRVEYYINQVGGVKDSADEARVYVIRADGRAHSRSGGGSFTVRWDAENLRWVRHRVGRVVERGDIIIVPPEPVVVRGQNLTRDVVDILYKIALSAGVLAGIAAG